MSGGVRIGTSEIYRVVENIDVIVIDHHLSEINLPNVLAIINPNRVESERIYSPANKYN